MNCVSVTLASSLTELTVRAILISGFALVGLLAIGWRQHARSQPKVPRDPTSPPTGIPVDYLDTPEYHRPDPIRRLLALATSSAIAILLGILAAIAIAATLSFAVIHFTRLLQG